MSLSPTTAVDAELALPVQLSLGMVDERRTRAYDDIDLDAPLWERDANEDGYVGAGEGVGVEGDVDVEDE